MITTPPLLEKLIGVAGAEAVLRLVEGHGGQRLWVPGNPTGSQLEVLYGAAIARNLSADYAGEYVKVPVARAWRVVQYRQAGLTVSDISRHLGVDRSTVQRLVRQYPTAAAADQGVSRHTRPVQTDLFESE